MAIETVGRACPLCASPRGRPILRAADLNARVIPDTFTIVRCACGMAYLDPIPARPGDVYPATYDAHAEVGTPRRKSKRFSLVDHLRPRRILDVGCGSGRDLMLLREKGWTVRGVETNPAAVERARGAGLDVRLGTLADAQLDGGSTDLITLFHVLEHVPDPVGVVREAMRLLSPGGLLLAHVPNFAGLNARLFRQHWYELDVPRHINFFTAATFRRMIELGGMSMRVMRTRATSGDFRRSMVLALGRNPLKPFDKPLHVAARMMNLFRWGDVLEAVGVNRAADRATRGAPPPA